MSERARHLHAVPDDPYLDLADENIRRLNSDERQESHRIWRALMLAPTLEIGEALLRGEAVPIDKLDPVWVRRFGIRD